MTTTTKMSELQQQQQQQQQQTVKGGAAGRKSYKVLPPKTLGASADQQPNPVSFTTDNLRRNLWENVRLFAEEVAEAAVRGKESALEPEGWTKINDTVNSIQLCLFLLREPYLSPTQVWLGHNQCKTTDRVNFKLSAIGKEYHNNNNNDDDNNDGGDGEEEQQDVHEQHQHQQQEQAEHDGDDGKARNKLRRPRSGLKSGKGGSKRKGGGESSSASGIDNARQRGSGVQKSSRSKRARTLDETPPPVPQRNRAEVLMTKHCGETAHAVRQEVDSEEERRLSPRPYEPSSTLTSSTMPSSSSSSSTYQPSRSMSSASWASTTQPTAVSVSSSMSAGGAQLPPSPWAPDLSSSSAALTSIDLYNRQLLHTLQPRAGPSFDAQQQYHHQLPYQELRSLASHSHHDLQRLAPSMVAAFPLPRESTPAPYGARHGHSNRAAATAAVAEGRTYDHRASGLASLLACVEEEDDAYSMTIDEDDEEGKQEEAEADLRKASRRKSTTTTTRKTRASAQVRVERQPRAPSGRGGKQRTGSTAAGPSSDRSDIYSLLN